MFYNGTEFEDGELRRTLADTILTVNGIYSYHMEAQMTEEEDIIFRVFAYGYSRADWNRIQEGAGCVLHFPEPKIIYLYASDILIPFALLKLRKTMEKERTPEKLEMLKKLIQDDIIGSIDGNVKLGNIIVDDSRKLKRLIHRLYKHIYAHYEEMVELNEMTDEAASTPP